MIGILPLIIIWCLWVRRCKARMEGKKGNKDVVCFQIKEILGAVVSKLKLVSFIFVVDIFIFQQLGMPRLEITKITFKLLYWLIP